MKGRRDRWFAAQFVEMNPDGVAESLEHCHNDLQNSRGARLPLFWCSDPMQMAHEQREIEADDRANEALGQIPASSQGRSSHPPLVKDMAKGAFKMFSSFAKQSFSALAGDRPLGLVQGLTSLRALPLALAFRRVRVADDGA